MNPTLLRQRACIGAVLAVCILLTRAAAADETATTPPQLGPVFLAQQHVLEPTDPLFRLVSNLEALIKVQVYAEKPIDAPYVLAVLKLGDKQRHLHLRGPAKLPGPYTGDPVMRPHRYDDSFTAIVPRQWVRPGLEIAVELRRYDYTEAQNYDVGTSTSEAVQSIHTLARKDLGRINVGAPSPLVMNMFDFHYFGRGRQADHPTGWEDEFKARLPVSQFTVHRARNIVLDPVVWMPRGGIPTMRVTSPEQYEKDTGIRLDGEQGMSLRLGRALKRAGGWMGTWRLYYINICGLQAGGQAAGFQSVGSIHRNGVILHEVGHSLSLPHWHRNPRYPYKLTMYGENPGEPTTPNAGPTWAFDLNRREFLPPYQRTADGGYEWTKDPMAGGGRYPGPEYIYRHFSDFSVNQMRNFLEKRIVFFNDQTGQYARWNDQTAAYDLVVESDGLQLPLERDVDVVSLLVTASLVAESASIVYPPIGPYTAGLIHRFDPTTKAGRDNAKRFGFDEKGFNTAVRVTQGGKVSTYILDLKLSPDDDPHKHFHVAAINLPARDGNVTNVELLYAPNMLNDGIGPDARLLASWPKR